MKDILFFDKMLTPKLITIVYWISLLAAAVGGLSVMFSGYGGVSVENFILGVVCAIAGAVTARIWCELLIIFFKMNEALQELRNK